MKKILALAVGMLLIPFTAFGMEALSDGDMDSITGQSGVAISLDNIQLYTDDGGTELWYETTNTTNDAAAVGLVYGASPSYLFINKISAPGALGASDATDEYGTFVGPDNEILRGDYSNLSDLTLTDKGRRINPSVLSIRVATTDENGVFSGALLGGDDGTGSGAYIEIGLPTIEIYAAEGSYDEMQIYVMSSDTYGTGAPVGFGDVTQAEAARHSLGTIYTTDSGSTTAILGGRIGITTLGQVPQAATHSGLADDLSESAAY